MINLSPEDIRLRRRLRRLAKPKPVLRNKLITKEIDGVVYLKKRARKPPFGYKIWDKDPLWLEPIPLELEALKRAKDHILNRCGYHAVAHWLTEVTGRKIAHSGLHKVLQRGY